MKNCVFTNTPRLSKVGDLQHDYYIPQDNEEKKEYGGNI